MNEMNKRMKQVAHYKARLNKVIALWHANDYAGCLKEANHVLENTGMPECFVSDFQYYRATSLDMAGDPEAALSVLRELTRKHPGCELYAHSIRITVSRLSDKARDVIRETPKSPILRNIWEALQATTNAPWWLTCEIARMDAADGNFVDAKKKIETLRALSPNDTDFLREALAVASMIGDDAWLASLIERIKVLREKRPWHLDLMDLLPEEEETPHAANL